MPAQMRPITEPQLFRSRLDRRPGEQGVPCRLAAGLQAPTPGRQPIAGAEALAEELPAHAGRIGRGARIERPRQIGCQAAAAGIEGSVLGAMAPAGERQDRAVQTQLRFGRIGDAVRLDILDQPA